MSVTFGEHQEPKQAKEMPDGRHHSVEGKYPHFLAARDLHISDATNCADAKG